MKHIYEQLGLTHLQGDVIITIMEKGGVASVPDIISALSETQKVNRTSIYSVLNSLERLNLVLKSESIEKRNNTYALISTNPEELIEKAIELVDKSHAIEDFKNKLIKAKKIASRAQVATEFYSLQNLEQVRDQVLRLIKESEKYILLMANSTVLKYLMPFITEKVENSNKIDILVQPTWNPTQQSFDEILEYYNKLLGENCVSMPLHIFEDVIGLATPIVEENSEIQNIVSSTRFIQILTEKGMVISTFFTEDVQLSTTSSGFYTEEQLISQNFGVIFFSIFKNHKPGFKKSTHTIFERIMKDRISTWFKLLKSMQ